jgi:multidrug efflux pump subunit AcrB
MRVSRHRDRRLRAIVITSFAMVIADFAIVIAVSASS